ncbi:MAG: toprim domain-containing protein [Erysipelotrichaceae bacterium]|nr:toprim domain-containing protein [Erysipelotrichaceae bacterium]
MKEKLTYKEAKDFIKDKYTEEYLSAKGLNLRKNISCLNPDHDDSNPSMKYYPDDKTLYCYSCRTRYDLLDVIGLDYNLTGFREKLEKAIELFNLDIELYEDTKKETRKQEKAVKSLLFNDEDNDDLYTRLCENALNSIEAIEHYEARGFSEDDIKRFGLGYTGTDFQLTKEVSERLRLDNAGVYKYIIPHGYRTGAGGYKAEAIDRQTYAKYSQGKDFKADILNEYYLTTPHDHIQVFVTEGEYDALSVEKCGFNAIALSSANNETRFNLIVNEYKPNCCFILALDNDKPGREAQKKIIENLKRNDYDYKIATIDDRDGIEPMKDYNEVLYKKGSKFLMAMLQNEIDKPSNKEKDLELMKAEYITKYSASYGLDGFIDKVIAKGKAPIETGFKRLDKFLDGGLFDGLYVVGANSSAGKTAFVLQIAETIAKNGEDVLYISLEMSKAELIARCISRHTLEVAHLPRLAKTTRGILNGHAYKNYPQDEVIAIENAVERFKENAGNLFIKECDFSLTVNDIKELVEKHIKVRGKVPVVVVDYLQILKPLNERQDDKQRTDVNIVELKRLSRDKNTTVIAISSFNRTAYGNNKDNDQEKKMGAFKESGAIEYSADVLLTLEAKHKNEDTKEVVLLVLKNRNGKTTKAYSNEENPLKFEFNGKYNNYYETKNK